MGIHGRRIRTVGNTSYPVLVTGTANHNFEDVRYKSACSSGDVRGLYQDLEFSSTGSGEAMRLRGIASGTNVATGGTVNGLHVTGRVASGGSVSGALNALRATLEVAGTTPTPGGTLSAIQVDSNISTGATLSSASAFMRFTNSGAYSMPRLMSIPAASNGTIFAAHSTQVMTHSIRICDAAGTAYYVMCTDAATNRS